MKVLLCGEKSECENLCRLLQTLPLGVAESVSVGDYEEIHRLIVDTQPSVAIVCDSGAKGMESVQRIKDSADIPIFWFSDDKGFAVHSYRLGCSYFGVKPILAEGLENAFAVVRHR